MFSELGVRWFASHILLNGRPLESQLINHVSFDDIPWRVPHTPPHPTYSRRLEPCEADVLQSRFLHEFAKLPSSLRFLCAAPFESSHPTVNMVCIAMYNVTWFNCLLGQIN